MCCDLRTEQYANQHVGNQEAEMSQNPQQASGPLWKNPTNCPEEEVPCDLHPLQVLGVDLQLHLHLHLPRLQQLWLLDLHLPHDHLPRHLLVALPDKYLSNRTEFNSMSKSTRIQQTHLWAAAPTAQKYYASIHTVPEHRPNQLQSSWQTMVSNQQKRCKKYQVGLPAQLH
jgi:hypothetical protein